MRTEACPRNVGGVGRADREDSTQADRVVPDALEGPQHDHTECQHRRPRKVPAEPQTEDQIGRSACGFEARAIAASRVLNEVG